MRAERIRGGGLAGLRFTAAVDGDALSLDERRALEELVAEAGFWSLPPVIAPVAPPGADRYRYQNTVDGDGRRHAVTAPESALPEELRPLVEWLRGRGGAAPRGAGKKPGGGGGPQG